MSIIKEARKKDASPAEKLAFFARSLKTEFPGIKWVMKKQYTDSYEFIALLKNNVEIGFTTISVNTESFGDITFGTSSGMFMSGSAVDKVKKKIEKEYKKQFGDRR